MKTDNNVYGYCPYCGAAGRTRERRPRGDDECVNGHRYPSSEAIPYKEYKVAEVSGFDASSKEITIQFKENVPNGTFIGQKIMIKLLP